MAHRQSIALPFTAVLAALMVLACVSPAPAAPESTMTIGVHVTLVSRWLDPAETEGLITPFMVLYAIHDALVKPMPGGLNTPSLAESWSVSKDGITYEFVIRKGARFHNGDPVTADDVKFTFERYRGSGNKLLKEKVKEVQVAAPNRVRFVLKEPWPDFMATYGTSATGAAWIVPKKYIDKVGEEGFKKVPIGAGPFKFVSFNPGVEQGVGLLCQLARLTVDYEGAPHAPRTMVAKLPTGDPQTRAMVNIFRFYEREVRFYTEAAAEVSLRTPSLYYGVHDAASGDFALLLEDLSTGRLGDQLGGATIEDTMLAVREVAAMHAAWWNRPLAGRAALAAGGGQSDQQGGRVALSAGMADLHGAGRPCAAGGDARHRRAAGRADHRHPRPLQRRPAHALPRRLAPGQRLLGTGPDQLEPGDVDRLADRDQGARPVRHRLLHEPEHRSNVRRTNEQEILKTYHELLREGGVTDYSYDDMLRDYRWTLLFCFAYPVNAELHRLTMSAMDIERDLRAAIEAFDRQRGAPDAPAVPGPRPARPSASRVRGVRSAARCPCAATRTPARWRASGGCGCGRGAPTRGAGRPR